MTTADDENNTTKTKIFAVLQTIEERLTEYKDVPEQVRQLRILQTQLHDALKEKQAGEERWREALYRILREALALLFRDRGPHKK